MWNLFHILWQTLFWCPNSVSTKSVCWCLNRPRSTSEYIFGFYHLVFCLSMLECFLKYCHYNNAHHWQFSRKILEGFLFEFCTPGDYCYFQGKKVSWETLVRLKKLLQNQNLIILVTMVDFCDLFQHLLPLVDHREFLTGSSWFQGMGGKWQFPLKCLLRVLFTFGEH